MSALLSQHQNEDADHHARASHCANQVVQDLIDDVAPTLDLCLPFGFFAFPPLALRSDEALVIGVDETDNLVVDDRLAVHGDDLTFHCFALLCKIEETRHFWRVSVYRQIRLTIKLKTQKKLNSLNCVNGFG